ncbi:BUD32 family EKC/KEOPS complex subunit [Alloalcanivorax mobilis]|uniref:toluene tolerance protein n=1 Tax=Alloalcanivorax mobilis TaxID=2019569 RepID=UPI000B5B25E8|nr:toluene tolerance protein [Alloalcanivorax mobilis]ASK33048.1 toluene tolerance protein [Alcanivorax sp. N3-2A]ASK36866.1 toluene tolerance protein [Alcanivorax sp. N3-2A]|tara:strand:+ start:523 stop:1185 length:663 start_codon:yes stop_codon:yes gene_type:complete
MIRIHPLSREQLERVVERSEVVERDSHGIKVLRLEDGRYLKYFRRKRYFNRELLSPAAVRFARHARQLDRLRIPTVEVESLHRIIGEPHTVAVYRPMPGDTLRALLARNAVDTQTLYRVGVFLARLHRQGVFFRSVHPGNIVIDGLRIGLIDLLDMKVRPWSMSRWARRRNWGHFLRCEEDRPHLRAELIDALLFGYRDAADLPFSEVREVAERIRDYLF